MRSSKRCRNWGSGKLSADKPQQRYPVVRAGHVLGQNSLSYQQLRKETARMKNRGNVDETR